MSKKRNMGISLDELLEDADFAYANDMDFNIVADGEELADVEISAIAANPYQPRKVFDEQAISELASSLDEHGLLQPVVLIEAKKLTPLIGTSAGGASGEGADGDGLSGRLGNSGSFGGVSAEYFLIAGERRLRAAKALGWAKIKAIIACIEPKKTQELALIENIHRRDLNPIELALAYKSIMEERGLTQDELAQVVKKSRPAVSNTLRLLRLSSATQELISSGKISMGHAKIIAGSADYEDKLAAEIVKNDLSVKECERLLSKLQNAAAKAKKSAKKQPNAEHLKLVEGLKNLGLKAKLKNNSLEFDLKDSKTLVFLTRFLS